MNSNAGVDYAQYSFWPTTPSTTEPPFDLKVDKSSTSVEVPDQCFEYDVFSTVLDSYFHAPSVSSNDDDNSIPMPFSLQPKDLADLYYNNFADEIGIYANSAIAQEVVLLDIAEARSNNSGVFNGCDPATSYSFFDQWDYSLFPEASIHSYGAEILQEYDELMPIPVPLDTMNGVELDESYGFQDVTLVYTVDSLGTMMPMATAYVLVKSINGVPCGKMLKVLFDTGGTKSMMNRSVIPPSATLRPAPSSTMCNTIAGNYMPSGLATCEELKFPEFDANLVVESQEFLVFDAPCSYDLILGNDFLHKMGMKIDYEHLELQWQGRTLPMNSKFSKERLAACVDICHFNEEEDEGLFDSFATTILDSTYDAMNIDQVIDENCQHLDKQQQDDLRRMFRLYYELFDGKLRTYNGAKMDIELLPDAKPVFRRPYPCPRIHLETFKKELHRLIEIGVLEKVDGASTYAMPSFIIPKKDGKVRFIADLRELNKQIKPQDYVLPVIQDILRKRKSFKVMSKIDLSMMFYSFQLTDRAKELCTISTPWGLHRWTRSPMGLRNSPSKAQSAIEAVLGDLDDVVCYIDDIAIFSDSWEEHAKLLNEVFKRLTAAGFSVNPLKCEFGITEGDFLGHFVTSQGIRPWSKKVEAVLALDQPKTARDVRTFLGMINWYRDFWPRRSHLISPFTKLLKGLEGKKTPIVWTDELTKCFREVKQVIAAEALNVYPDHNKPFDVFTDSSDFQMGATIMQEGKPICYFSRRLTGPQSRYSTIEKELLSIVSTLTEYKTMLFGAKIRIFTDHRNLTFNNFNTQRVLRWRCFLEPFNAEWYYLQGKLNVLADAFSRLPKFDFSGAEERQDDLSPEQVPIDPGLLPPDQQADPDDDYKEETFDQLFADMEHGDHDALHVFMNLRSTVQNPLRFQWLAECQQADAELNDKLTTDAAHYHRRTFGRDEIDLICYSNNPDDATASKIALTDTALDACIEYFHHLLNHPGTQALHSALAAKYYHPNLSNRVKTFACDTCQRTKAGERGYGHLPPRSVEGLTPWAQVDADLIGPWYIKTTGRSGKSYEFYALTAIDRATGYPEGVTIKRKTSEYVANKFNHAWLSRYPKPDVCAHDQGGEFIGPEFQQLLYDAGIKSAPSTARNPQSNAIVERLHLTMGNSIRAHLADKEPRTLHEAELIMEDALANALYAVRANISEATGFAPGALAFHRDMLFNQPITFDMSTINSRRQRRVDRDNLRMNSKRHSYDYKVGDRVMKKIFDTTKMDPRWEGPFPIRQVHINGNVTVQLRPHVRERLNIRRVKPYKPPTPSALDTINQDQP